MSCLLVSLALSQENKAKGKKVTCDQNLHQLCIAHILLKPEGSLVKYQGHCSKRQRRIRKKNKAACPCGAYGIAPESAPSPAIQNCIKPSLF